jgi:uncharacterized protein (TIGR02246 family)
MIRQFGVFLLSTLLGIAAIAGSGVPKPMGDKDSDTSSERTSIEAVLKAYNLANTKLDAASATPLFTPDARIYEQGGDEGPWTQYLREHLTPEFGDFQSMSFSDYRVEVTVAGGFAYAAETYRYEIVLKEKGERVARLGAATSVLRKEPNGWKIVQYHNSSRKPPAP